MGAPLITSSLESLYLHLCNSIQGLPYRSALKVLAQRFLKRRIQEGSHDSVIDARTALDLVHLKIKHGACSGAYTLDQ